MLAHIFLNTICFPKLGREKKKKAFVIAVFEIGVFFSCLLLLYLLFSFLSRGKLTNKNKYPIRQMRN